MTAAPDTDHYRVIEAGQNAGGSTLKNVWAQRTLAYTFALRDLKAQYAQMWLGLFWAVLQPLSSLAVYSFVFGFLLNMPTGGIPYPLYALAGVLGWAYFTNIVYQSGSSLIQARDLIKKVHFPRLLLPLAKSLLGLPELGLGFALLLVGSFFMGGGLSWALLLAPLFVALNWFVGFTLALWLSALTVRYRDFSQLIPYLLNLMIWLTPVFYSGSLLPEKWRWLLYLNPVACIVTGYRWTLLNAPAPEPHYAFGFLPVVAAFFVGWRYFKRVEATAADIL